MNTTLRWMTCMALLPWLVQCAQEPPKPSASVRQGQTTGGTGNGSGNSGGGDATGGGGTGTPPGATPGPTPTPSGGPIPSGPTTPALAVTNGTVTFDMSAAKAGLPGASFTATMSVSPQVGTTPASMSLSGFAVKGSSATGFVLYRPVLVAVAPDGSEKQFPIGTNINQKIPKDRSMPLSNLLRVPFEGVTEQHKVKLRFSALEPLEPAIADGIPNYRECKAPQSFNAVATSLQPCKSCHSGLFAYDFIDKDMATACGQNLKMIDVSLNPTGKLPAIPGGGHHGADGGATNTAVQAWKRAEGL